MEENHLYRLAHVPPREAQKIEQQFSIMEDKAGDVIRIMTQASRMELTLQQKIDWSLFLLAQRARVPNRLNIMKQMVREGLDAILTKPDPEFDRLKGDKNYRNLKEYAEAEIPAALANHHLRLVMKVIGNEDNIHRVSEMVWSVCNLSGGHSVILGDDPVILVGALHEQNCVMALPISPTAVFLAASTPQLMQHIQRYDPKKIAPNINHNQAAQAQRVVVGDVMPAFLDKRMPK